MCACMYVGDCQYFTLFYITWLEHTAVQLEIFKGFLFQEFRGTDQFHEI